MNSKVFILVIFFTGFLSPVFSQENLKIGHVNIPEIIQKLPETDSVQALLKKETDELEKMYNEMVSEHDANVKKYEKEKAGYSEFIRQTKESELMDSADKIQQFQQNATQKVQKRNTDLLQPIYDKVNKAIKKVAANEGFTYILDVSNGTVVYQSPGSLNINPLVLKELGL
jgi:outer membrane protein